MATVETVSLAVLKLAELWLAERRRQDELKKKADDAVKNLPKPPQEDTDGTGHR